MLSPCNMEGDHHSLSLKNTRISFEIGRLFGCTNQAMWSYLYRKYYRVMVKEGLVLYMLKFMNNMDPKAEVTYIESVNP